MPDVDVSELKLFRRVREELTVNIEIGKHIFNTQSPYNSEEWQWSAFHQSRVWVVHSRDWNKASENKTPVVQVNSEAKNLWNLWPRPSVQPVKKRKIGKESYTLSF